MKWDDISEEIPGRSTISCRLHYQNYLEKRADWDEESRNKLARVYDRYDPSLFSKLYHRQDKTRHTRTRVNQAANTPRRLKPELWNPIATELGVPWRACEAMHWALGEADMCRRANVAPFPMSSNRPEPASAPAHAPAPTPSAGRVAQRDRMRGSTRVFEGRDITTITSPGFHSVNGNGTAHGHGHAPYHGVRFPMSPHGIGNGRGFPGYDDEDDEEEDEDDEDEDDEQLQQVEPRARRRRLGSGTRLPGLAELDRSLAAGQIAASEGVRLIKQEEEVGRRINSCREHDRRGSAGSGASGRSRRSR